MPEPTVELICADVAEGLLQIPRNGAQLIATSPPYNVAWDYGTSSDGDNRPVEDYVRWLGQVLGGCYTVLQPGGVLALNVPQHIRQPEHRAYPLAAKLQCLLLDQGWLLREPIVWVKWRPGCHSYATTTAIGGPRNPYLRPCHEMVLLASKDTYLMEGKDAKRWPGTAEAFGSYLELAKDVWAIQPGRGRKKGWPLMFPEELVSRLVALYSSPGDLVVDPFAGLCTTGVVARRLGRRFVGIDVNESFLAVGRQRIFPDTQPPLGLEPSALPATLEGRERELCMRCGDGHTVLHYDGDQGRYYLVCATCGYRHPTPPPRQGRLSLETV